MSKQLKSLSLVALFAAMFMFQSPTPANAGWGWLCWWCGPPSAEELISERPNLARQPKEVRDFIAETVEEFRNNGAAEIDVERYLDKIEESYQRYGGRFGGMLTYASTVSEAAKACFRASNPYAIGACLTGVAIGTIMLSETSDRKSVV